MDGSKLAVLACPTLLHARSVLCLLLLLQMQRGVEDLLQHQRLQLRAEEAAQLRQFRVRLAEVEAQLAADKRAAAADQDSWMSKTVSKALCS